MKAPAKPKTTKPRKTRMAARPAGFHAPPQMTMTSKEFTEVVDRLGLSIRELSERLGINRATVHAYMNGGLKPTTVIALAITMLAIEVEREREAARRRLKKAGYGDAEMEKLMSSLPSGLVMALTSYKPGRGEDDDE